MDDGSELDREAQLELRIALLEQRIEEAEHRVLELEEENRLLKRQNDLLREELQSKETSSDTAADKSAHVTPKESPRGVVADKTVQQTQKEVPVLVVPQPQPLPVQKESPRALVAAQLQKSDGTVQPIQSQRPHAKASDSPPAVVRTDGLSKTLTDSASSVVRIEPIAVSKASNVMPESPPARAEATPKLANLLIAESPPEEKKSPGGVRFEPLDEGPSNTRRKAPPPPSPQSPHMLTRSVPDLSASEEQGPSPVHKASTRTADFFRLTFGRSSARATESLSRTSGRQLAESARAKTPEVAPSPISRSKRDALAEATPPLSRASKRDNDSGPPPILSRGSKRDDAPARSESSSGGSLAPPASSNQASVSPILSRATVARSAGSSSSSSDEPGSSSSSSRMKVVIADTVTASEGSKKVALYLLEVSTETDAWKLARRYSHFHNLFQELQQRTSRTLTFPPKKFVLNLDDAELRKRGQALQKFINEVLELPHLVSTVEFMRFLNPLENPCVATLCMQPGVSMTGMLNLLMEHPFNQIEWEPRFVMVVGFTLFCFAEPDGVEPRQTVSLDYCAADFEGEIEDGKWCFSVKHLLQDKPIIFHSPSSDECKRWIAAIRNARLAPSRLPEVNAAVAAKTMNGEVVEEEAQGVSFLRRVAGGQVRLSFFSTVPDTVSSILGANVFSLPDSEDNCCVKDVSSEVGGGGSLTSSSSSALLQGTSSAATKVVVAGTMEKLVEKLTHPEFFSVSFANSLLLTYRSFLEPRELLDLLLARFHQADVSESRRGGKRGGLVARSPIQDRVCMVLEAWLDVNFWEFVDDEALSVKLMAFVYSWLEGTLYLNDYAERIKEKVQTKVLKASKAADDAVRLANAPLSIVPKMIEVASLNYMLDFDPLEVARQLTLIDEELFLKIKPFELLGQKWSKEKLKPLAPNVLSMIARFNTVSLWVVSVILHGGQDPAIRAALFQRLVLIAEHLRLLRAYGPCCAVVGGLHSPSIMRLKKMQELVTDAAKLELVELEHLISPEKNHKFYRTLLEQAAAEKTPCIPYLGQYLADLTFIEDGNPDYRGEGEKLINMEKRHMISKVYLEIIGFQSRRYALRPVPTLQYYLNSCEVLTESAAYSLSLQIEPREAQQEK